MIEDSYLDNDYIIKRVLIGVIIISVLINVFMYLKLQRVNAKIRVTEALLYESEERLKNRNDAIKVDEKTIYVDVSGQVNKPGVYKFNTEKRLFEVIKEAGGELPTADLTLLNLADVVYDKSKVYIPKKGEIITESNFKNSQSTSFSKQNNKVNINTSSHKELQTLTGIGETKARDIISYREDNGPFKKIEDILLVKGIGPSTYDKIKSVITVR